MKAERIALAVVLSLSLAAPSLATPPDTPKLSRSERKDRIKNLSEKYRQFLAEVEPIMQPEELDTFLLLESDAQRDLYIEDFWHRRAVAQGISAEEVRQAYYDRRQTAKEKFGSAASDRGKIYIVQGPPAEIKDYGGLTGCKLIQPLQVWTYGFIPSLGHNVRLIFYVPRSAIDYRLWQPAQMNQEGLAEVISSEVMALSQEEVAVALDRVFGPCNVVRGRPSRYTHLECECADGDQILKLVQSSQMSQTQWQKAFLPPPVNPEDVKKILRSVVIANPNAVKLAAQISVDFPRKQRSRTDLRMTILMPRSQLALKDVGGVKLYSVDVIGEVLKDDQLFENYRYRFDYPPGTSAQVAAVIDRYLPPGQYRSRIRIADLNSNAEAILENAITVPALESPESVASRPKEDSRLRIVPLPDELLRGLQHIDTITASEVKAVEYYLDGKKVVTKRSPPFVFDVDLGDVPNVHRIRAVALNEKGEFIGGDEIVVNEGNAPFRIRIVSPRVAVNVKGKTQVEMHVVVPEDKKLDKVELYLNDTRLATLFGPPYLQTVDVPPGIGYLRAVGTLKDSDQPPSEDVVVINAPQYMEELNVHLIELPTTVVRDGRPLNDLTESAFKVLDEGKPVKIAKFERVTNLPLSIGLAIDTSASMRTRIAAAQKAAAQFLATVTKKGDQAFLVSFDIQPMLAQRWSSDIAEVNAGLARLRTDESTALYDAIVYSLYNFVGVKGQKALIVVTDGKDTSSRYSFEQALEYARRAAVPIYGIGIGIGAGEIDVRYRFGKFCSETGGNIFYIDEASDLHRIYDNIQNELRSQYILAFYPPEGVKPGSKWREVAVQVSDGKAKTIRGYYP